VKSPNCNHECDHGNCPFMTHPYDADRQVCVKCGHEYTFDRKNWFSSLLFAALMTYIIVVFGDGKTPSDTNPPPDAEVSIEIPIHLQVEQDPL